MDKITAVNGSTTSPLEIDNKKMTGSGVSSLDLRKANKPLMEKRRRARINKSLNELKSILMESTKRNSPGHSKWEKADILEMTVSYLHCLRNQQKTTRTDPLAMGQFIAGFSECVRQIQKFGTTEISMDRDVQQKLNDHLLTCLKTFSDDASRGLQNSPTTDDSRGHSPRSTIMTSPSPEPSPLGSLISEDTNPVVSPAAVIIHNHNGDDVQIASPTICPSLESQLIMRRRPTSPYNKDVWRPW